MIDIQAHILRMTEQIHQTAAEHLKDAVHDEMRQVRTYPFYDESVTYRRSGDVIEGPDRDVVDTEALLQSVEVDEELNVVSGLPYATKRLVEATGLIANVLDSWEYPT